VKARIDAKLNRSLSGGKPTPPRGGKALQRLFTYLGRRDPALNEDVVASIPVPKTVRQKFGFTAKALRAKTLTAAAAARPGRKPPAAKSLSAAMARAANALSRLRKHGKTGRKGTGAAPTTAPAPAGGAQTWQPIGPTRLPNGQTYGTNRVDVSGRVSCIAIDPRDPKHLLVGAAGGGIWESVDTGATWNPRTDQMPSLAIGAVVFDLTNPKRVYAGSGEGNFYANLGAGVYKSTDGGSTWIALASAPFMGVGFFSLVVDPKDPTLLYAATTSGLFKSANSGASWSLKRGGRCWSISVHPSGGAVEVLASFVDGLYVSTNAGNSFTQVPLPSLPVSPWARLAVDRSLAAPDVAYVFGAADNAAFLWRRAGAAWTRITSLPAGLNVNQAWYDWYVMASPMSNSQVFLGAIDGYRGELSGSSTWKWTNITTQGNNSIHPDQHCLAFSPNNPAVVFAGNDGGLYRSADSGATWKSLNSGLGISEIEYLASDPTTWKWLMAGTQDNGTIAFTGTAKWDHLADGDGGDCGVNQLDPNIIYHSFYNVSLERSNNKGASWTSLAPPSLQSLFYPPVEVFGSTVAIGATSLIVTRTGGPPWTTIVLGLALGEVSSAMREIDANTILVGTNKGGVLVVSWNGTSWIKKQLASPAARYISCIAVDPSNPQRVWITLSQIGGPPVYRSDNGGTSWVNCSTGLPSIPMNAVVVDPANFKRAWVAADVGVYQTLDLGASWSTFSKDLPNAMAVDLVLHKQDRMLICATRNRGAWAIAVP
jgi:photosystem II stability/assembly factor-like uncharacterized protein